MGNLQRSSTTGNLLKHDVGGNLMSECCCDLPYAGNIATHLVKVNQVGTTLFDETAVYQASSGDFAPYWVCLIGGQWMACGKLVATGAWVIRYADQAFWDQDGSWPFTPSLYQIPLTSFNGNGCPTGTYEWKLPNRTPQSTYTITLSEPP